MSEAAAFRAAVGTARRVVVKIGSALLTEPGRGVARAGIEDWGGQMAAALADGRELLLVSSGAVAEGADRLGFAGRPTAMHELQAAAAVGQVGLMDAYSRVFASHGRHPALVLLTHDDLSDRRRYLNARATLQTLLRLGVIPVINENDTVATDEIRFGDNDTLAALVANLMQAEALVLLTDRSGLHRSDPRVDPKAPLVDFAFADDATLSTMAGAGAGVLGRGGMVTKLKAAKLAARSGAHTVIADGRRPAVLREILAGEPVGTLLASRLEPLMARKQWIADQLRPKGDLILDAGAVRAIRERGVSLLPVGVIRCVGRFVRGEVVRCLDEAGVVIAQGLVNYSAEEVQQLAGAPTSAIAERLGYGGEEELIHRDNLVTF